MRPMEFGESGGVIIGASIGEDGTLTGGIHYTPEQYMLKTINDRLKAIESKLDAILERETS